MPKRSIPLFIDKLWNILEEQSNSLSVCWTNDGNSFIIFDQDRFAQFVLPSYFKHSRIESFIRQLNMYNFHKIITPEGLIAFHHRLFIKHHNQLLIGIKRRPTEEDIIREVQLIEDLAPQGLDLQESLEEQKPMPDEPISLPIYQSQPILSDFSFHQDMTMINLPLVYFFNGSPYSIIGTYEIPFISYPQNQNNPIIPYSNYMFCDEKAGNQRWIYVNMKP